MAPMRLVSLLLCLLVSPASASAQDAPDEIELIPAEQANWTPWNLGIMVISVLGGWKYWYGERWIEIETVPAEARLDLYYVRANFQKRFEQGSAPARVRLPKRADTTTRDYIKIKVVSDGYTTKEESFQARGVDSKLLIRLDPLPNALVAFSYTYIDDRTTLTLHTTEEPQFHVSKSGGTPGFVLSLARTASKVETPPRVFGGRVKDVKLEQAGEDVLIRVATVDDDAEVRSRQTQDPVRDHYVFQLDLAPKGARTPGPDEIQRRVRQVRFTPGDPCNSGFEAALREKIDPAAATGAYRAGGLVGLYRREAMIWLGSFARGTVHTIDGQALRTGNPIELELALQDARDVKDFPALLGAIARGQDEPEAVLRSLLVPDMSPETFQAVYMSAEQVRGACTRAPGSANNN